MDRMPPQAPISLIDERIAGADDELRALLRPASGDGGQQGTSRASS
jgi:hypothetical protein